MSALLVAPASDGNLLAKEVSTFHVDMDWTEVAPGLELLMKGTAHTTALLFATPDPTLFRLVGLLMFHGTTGIRGFDPLLGSFTILSDTPVTAIRAVGTFVLDPGGFPIPVDIVVSLRTRGTLTVEVGPISVTEDVNLLGIIQIRNGEIFWARAGVPLGWPFQPPAP